MTGPRAFKGLHRRVQKRLGEPAKAGFLAQSGEAQIDVDIIFQSHFRELDEAGVTFGGPHPVAWIDKDLVDDKVIHLPDDGDKLVIEGKEYKIREIEPESSQYIKLILQDTDDVRDY